MMGILRSIPFHVDYAGQGKAERLYRGIVTLFAIVGVCWGYAVQQLSQAVYVVGAGCALAALLTVPPWPMYRRNPLPWLSAQSSTHPSQAQPAHDKAASKKKK